LHLPRRHPQRPARQPDQRTRRPRGDEGSDDPLRRRPRAGGDQRAAVPGSGARGVPVVAGHQEDPGAHPAHAQRGQAAEELSVRATVHICRFLLEEPHAGASRGTRIAPRRQGNGPEWGEVSARCGGSFWMAPLSGLAGRAPRRSTDGEGSSLSPVTRPANPDPATRTGSEPNGTTTTSPVPASGPWAGSEMAGLVLRPPMTVELRGAPGRSACAAISDNGATKPIPPEHTRTSPQSGPFPWRLGATPVRSLTAHDPTDPHPQDT